MESSGSTIAVQVRIGKIEGMISGTVEGDDKERRRGIDWNGL